MKKIRPYLALLILALIAFWPLVLHPTETLYSNTSDLLAQHLHYLLHTAEHTRQWWNKPLQLLSPVSSVL